MWGPRVGVDKVMFMISSSENGEETFPLVGDVTPPVLEEAGGGEFIIIDVVVAEDWGLLRIGEVLFRCAEVGELLLRCLEEELDGAGGGDVIFVDEDARESTKVTLFREAFRVCCRLSSR